MTPILIVAEAAQGYEGDVTLARMLVRAAAAGAADAVKFQMVQADEIAVPSYKHFELFRGLEMPPEAWGSVADDASRLGLRLGFDVFGPRSLALALDLGAAFVKVHATDFFHDALVDAALANAPQVHLSIGGIRMTELDAFMEKHGGRDLSRLVLLSGYQAEPTALEDNHIARLGALRDRFRGVGIGWMDHASGASDEAHWLGALAVPYGTSVIEKHVTLARSLELEDWVSAVDAEAMRLYVSRVRAAERAVGRADLELTSEEEAYRGRALKVVVAAVALAPHTEIAGDSLTLKRAAMEPGKTPFLEVPSVTGRKPRRHIAASMPVYAEDLT